MTRALSSLSPPRFFLVIAMGLALSLALVLVLAVAMALSIAASRVFLQVHYLTDILAGLCSGTAWLAVCIASLEAARHRKRLKAHRAAQATGA